MALRLSGLEKLNLQAVKRPRRDSANFLLSVTVIAFNASAAR